MTAEGRCRVYEQEAVLRATGEFIRPGGFSLTERALSFCALPAGARVLDVGCGAGATVERLRADYRLEAVGVDPSVALLRSGLSRSRTLPLMLAPGERLPVADGSMDAALAECSLSVAEDAGRVLGEINRVLRDGGKLVVSDVYARNPEGVPALRRLPLASCLCGAMAEWEIVEMVQAHGFEVVLWEDQTAALKQFVGQLIFSHGSLEQFWSRMAPRKVSPAQIGQAASLAKPGYFLLIAGKN